MTTTEAAKAKTTTTTTTDVAIDERQSQLAKSKFNLMHERSKRITFMAKRERENQAERLLTGQLAKLDKSTVDIW